MTRRLFFALVCLCTFGCATVRAIDFVEIEKLLTTTGIEGEVHGASHDLKVYVFTYRNPEDFFDYVHMSLVPSADVLPQLLKLNRHDRIRVVGSFHRNPSPQKHIDIASLAVVKKYEPGSEFETIPYHYQAKIPDELLKKTKALFLVHAVHAQGKILVVEYKDAVLPIFVKNGELTQKLFRNDIVRLQFKIQKHPDRPVHIRLDETSDKPVEVVESIQARHGKPGTVEGALILFPKSPQVLFNVFAVLEEAQGGLKRQFTIVNFEDEQVFAKVREKLQIAWDRHPGKFVNGRNKLISTAVRVKAKGIFNEVDPNQANAQILVDSPDHVEVLD